MLKNTISHFLAFENYFELKKKNQSNICCNIKLGSIILIYS